MSFGNAPQAGKTKSTLGIKPVLALWEGPHGENKKKANTRPPIPKTSGKFFFQCVFFLCFSPRCPLQIVFFFLLCVFFGFILFSREPSPKKTQHEWQGVVVHLECIWVTVVVGFGISSPIRVLENRELIHGQIVVESSSFQLSYAFVFSNAPHLIICSLEPWSSWDTCSSFMVCSWLHSNPWSSACRQGGHSFHMNVLRRTRCTRQVYTSKDTARQCHCRSVWAPHKDIIGNNLARCCLSTWWSTPPLPTGFTRTDTHTETNTPPKHMTLHCAALPYFSFQHITWRHHTLCWLVHAHFLASRCILQ